MEVRHGQELRLALGEPFSGGAALALGAVTIAAGNGELTITCLMGKFRNGELTTGFIELNANFRDFTLHYGLPPSNLLSLPWIKGVLRADAVEH